MNTEDLEDMIATKEKDDRDREHHILALIKYIREFPGQIQPPKVIVTTVTEPRYFIFLKWNRVMEIEQRVCPLCNSEIDSTDTGSMAFHRMYAKCTNCSWEYGKIIDVDYGMQ